MLQAMDLSKFLFGLAFFISWSGHAQTPQFTFYDKYAYDFVLSTCDMDINSAANLVTSTKEYVQEYFSYLDITRPHIPKNNFIARDGIGKNVDLLLHSYGYYVGLRKCFPDSYAKRHLYTANLLLFDAAGKFSALSIMVASIALPARGIAMIPLKPVRVALNGGLTLATFGMIGSAIYDLWGMDEDRRAAETDTEEIQQRKNSLFKSLQENVKIYRDLLKTNLTESQSEQKANIQFYVDTLKKQNLTAEEQAQVKRVEKELADRD
jgi:hypothetical protein